MSIEIKKAAPDGERLVSHTYEFLAPTRVTVRYPDGREVLTGYGITEKVYVMEPGVQFLCCNYEKLKEIPLADGSYIIAYPEDMRTRFVWGS